ncbi:Aste57867_21427 [Aphanomyces stellatus]|uniref:Aste57867_21427 protein n=1 Tax=Aphanomyces stellatus TaxID=120398 RepID=A0A485LHF7_9STRA|nr:hypothetical protein As57867_021358 [Aphanomyces stellatus]VFT98098.1 Aste57867_21427 [Aphanomyces stellatus]
METELASLERRVLALQARLGVTSKDVHGSPLQYRLRDLTEKLQQLESSLEPPNAAPLRTAYNQHKKYLEGDFLDELKTPGSTAQLKKAILLTSQDSINEMVANAKKLRALEQELASPTPPTITQDVQQALRRVETRNMLVTRQVLAHHEAVEGLLTQYAAIVHGMSKKFQLYDHALRRMEATRGHVAP